MDPVARNLRATHCIDVIGDGHVRWCIDGSPGGSDTFYRIDDQRIASAFGVALPPELADLVDVAMAVYISDRLVPRRHPDTPGGIGWTRRFKIHVPLRMPGHWKDSSLEAKLAEILWFFTEDDWTFDFGPRNQGRRLAERQAYLFPEDTQGPVLAALFSGGLDSLAGLYCELARHPDRRFILVSGATNVRTGAIQRSLVRRVERETTHSIKHVVLPFRRVGREPLFREESSQRSRGFVLTVLGAVAAALGGAQELAVYENGIGAINLPYSDAQLGVQLTRSAHPLALMAMRDFLGCATGRPFDLRLPFMWKTKAQLCAQATDAGMGAIAASTISCDSYPLRIPRSPQCGICTSCLLRRQALTVAGLGRYDLDSSYRDNIMDRAGVLSSEKLRPYRNMVFQVRRLRRALTSQQPWIGLVDAYPQLLEIAAGLSKRGYELTGVQKEICSLYQRYVQEWHTPLATAQIAESSRAVMQGTPDGL